MKGAKTAAVEALYRPPSEVEVPGGVPKGRLHQRTRTDKRVITEREMRALDLVVAGASYRQIAKALDIQRGSAVNLVRRALEKRAADMETPEEARIIYLERLEFLWRRWFPRAVGNESQGIEPSAKAAEVALKILAAYARVTGIESPVKVRGEVTVVDEAEQRARVLESLRNFAQRVDVIEGVVSEDGGGRASGD